MMTTSEACMRRGQRLHSALTTVRVVCVIGVAAVAIYSIATKEGRSSAKNAAAPAVSELAPCQRSK